MLSSPLASLILVVALTGFAGIPGDDPPGPSPTLEADAPADAVVLLDGTNWDGWRQRDGEASRWRIQQDGSVLVNGGDAITKEQFGDHQIHLEFRCPLMPEATGQARGNSGVYVQGRYEVQVLDTYGLPAADNHCGGIYSISPPLVNASRPPEQWQTYDIVFRAPRLEGDTPEPARITVIHNGLVIHNNLILPHPTPGGVATDTVARGPLLLQDHGDAVRYRNIWIRRLDP